MKEILAEHANIVYNVINEHNRNMNEINEKEREGQP